jgi:hypothetical protein
MILGFECFSLQIRNKCALRYFIDDDFVNFEVNLSLIRCI